MWGSRVGGSRWKLEVENELERNIAIHSTAGRRRPRHQSTVLIVALCTLTVLIVGSVGWRVGTDNTPQKAHMSYTTHAPILIMSDADFNNASGVTSGSGTAEDPYIISGWDISTNTFGACIFVYTTTAHFVIRDCHLHDPTAVCLETYASPNGDIVDCLVDDGVMGIAVYQSPYTNVTGNTVMNMDQAGIVVLETEWVNVTGNQATQDNITAMMCSVVNNVTVENNILSSNNGTGVMVMNATDLQFIGNNVSENGVNGFQIDDVRNLRMQGNNITSNLGSGIYLSNSTSSRIFHNRFIGNYIQAYQENVSLALWDDGYPSGGNYWSDYVGNDIYNGPDQDIPGSDGIGDLPYTFTMSGVDRYPFVAESMEPIPEFGTALVPVLSVLALFVVVEYSRRRNRTL